MAKHARLSASGSKQWINCPGSIQREQDIGGQDRSSMFGMQGTAAHALADYCLTSETDADDHVGTRLYVHEERDTVAIPARVAEGGARESRLVEEGYVRFDVVDGEGNGELTEVKAWAVQMFVALVRKEFSKADLDAVLTTEVYMDGSWIHPLMGGTADANFLGMDLWIKLFDLKYGAGVSVEVEDNTQLKIYSVLILRNFPQALGVDMWIVQPRLNHQDGPIRHKRYTRAELEEFTEELRRLADQTQKRNAPIKAGDWCLWCKAKPHCKEFLEETQERARMQFDDPPDVIPAPTEDLEQLAKIAAWIPMLDALISAVNGAIGRHIHQGRKVEGFKLVRMKTNRKFGRPSDDPDGRWQAGDEVPEEEIVRLMRQEGLVAESELYHPRKLLTLAQMEKLGKDAKKAIKSITYKPEGRLTVAPSSDPREEVPVDASASFPDDDIDLPG